MRAPCIALATAGVALSVVAITQPIGAAPAAIVSAAADAGPPTMPDLPGDKANPAEGHKEVSGPSTDARGQDLDAELESLRAEVAQYRAARAAAAKDPSLSDESKLALFGLLASLGWTLAAGLKKVATKAGKPGLKRWLPLVALLMGVIAGFASSRADGVGTVDAVLLGAGPPLSVLLHELGEMLWGRGKKAAEAEA